MDWEAASAELGKKLDPAHVKPPAKFGPKGDYIEGWHAIAEANRIFGYGEWSYEVRSLEKVSLTEGKDSKGNPQWQAAYTCIVRVVVGDVIREDVGFGSGFSKQIGDTVEGATKEAVTDALKRCLRTFGNPFGLALYDKKRASVGVDVPEFDPAAARDRIKRKLETARTLADLQDAWKSDADTIAEIREAKPPMFAELNAAKDKRKAELSPPDPAKQAPMEQYG